MTGGGRQHIKLAVASHGITVPMMVKDGIDRWILAYFTDLDVHVDVLLAVDGRLRGLARVHVATRMRGEGRRGDT